MNFTGPTIVLLGSLIATAPMAQTKEEAIRIATESGACGARPVTDAAYVEGGQIRAICGLPLALVPLVGGLAPAVGVGAIAVAAVAASGGGGGSTPNTR